MTKVSVVITTYNRKGLLDNAIQSVLRQTYKNIELTVTDDGSTDGTDKYIKKYKNDLIYINEGHSKYYTVNRNRGVHRATGKYIAFLDDDNWWEETFMEKHLDYRAPDVAITYSGRRVYEASTIYKIPLPLYEGYTENLNRVLDIGDLMFVRKHVVEVGGFDEEKDKIGYCSDMKLVDRILKNHPHDKMVRVPYYLHNYTSLPDDMTHRKLKDRKEGKYKEEQQWKF